MGYLFFNVGLWVLIGLFAFVAYKLVRMPTPEVKYKTAYLDNEWNEFKYNVGQRVKKKGGSYEASGKVVAAFAADDGSPRYVFRFDEPSGLLHIFNESNLVPEQESINYPDVGISKL